MRAPRLLVPLALVSAAFGFRPETAKGRPAATEAPQRLRNLEALEPRHLRDEGDPDSAGLPRLKGDADRRILERLNRRLARDGGEVRPIRVQIDALGNRHVRLQQYYKGIPIVGTEMVVHVDPRNGIYAMGGNTARPMALATSGGIPPAAAGRSARATLGLDTAAAPKDSARRVIYDGRLAYELLLPGNGPDRWLCYVDANTGETLHKENRVPRGAPVGGARAAVHGLVLVKEGGADGEVEGWRDTRNLYYLRNDSAHWGVYDQDAADWEQQAAPDWGANDRAAVSLARNIAITQEYVATVLGRNSFDDRGAFAQAYAHEGSSYVNAYWDGSGFHFGDGDGVTAAPLTSLDVVAHEFGHAVTEYTSNLTYSGESGALNESFSDIMGAVVEFHAQPDGRSSYPRSAAWRADYLLGEDCWLESDALRDMRDPGRYGQPSYYLGSNWDPGQEVHANSGVQNFAFYLLAEGGRGSNDGHPYDITGLGTEASGAIALYANMYLLTASSRYRDARDAWVLAATTLGYDAGTVSAVWTACGIAPLESRLSASAGSLAFGNVGTGTTRTLQVTLRNDGASPTIVSALSFSNPAFGSPATAPFSVPGGGTVRLDVTFHPADLSSQAGQLAIASNAVDHPSISIALSGNGTLPPRSSLTPTAFVLDLSPLDAPADRTAVLSNTGAADLLFQVEVEAQTQPSAATAAATAPAARAAMAAPAPPALDRIYAAANYALPRVDGEVVVAFKPGAKGFAQGGFAGGLAGASTHELAMAGDPATGLRAHGGRKLILLRYDAAGAPPLAKVIAGLRADANVAYAEPNYVYTLSAIPNDPGFANLYGMRNTGQSGGTPGADISAAEAWDRHTGNRGNILLGEIDTGIDYLHPDLAANIWTNQAEANGSPGVDDDRNGYVDDVHGYDFINNDADPMDDHYHGTHVAGTIAGVGNNGVGVAGVAWTASVAALKIFNASGSTTLAAILNAIDYSNAMGMRITSNSWGGGAYSQAMYDLIREGRDLGHLFIAAAGNDGTDNDTYPHYPSSYDLDNIIAVAATDRNDAMASFSCFGAASVDLGAPGVATYSCAPGGGYQNLSGTSMATPHVSGAAYLLWSFQPSLSASEVKGILLATADPIPALGGRTVSGGRLNVARALEEAGPEWLTAAPAEGSVAGGASRDIVLTVNPSRLAPGRWTGDVRVAGNDPERPTAAVRVTVNVSGCKNVTLSPASGLDFGNVYIGTTGRLNATLRNRCNEVATVTSMTADNGTFAASATFPLTLRPFGEADVPIGFRPVAEGPVSATLTVASDDDAHGSQTLALRATGVLGPMVRVSPSTLTGTAAPGGMIHRKLTLSNDGGMPLDWTLSGARTLTSRRMEDVYPPSHFIAPAKGAEDARIGQPVLERSGGPDNFGYRWVDSDAPGGPQYVWNDILATGTRLATASGCDDCYEARTLSFPFPYYGQNYTTVYVSSNGYLTFGAGSTQYSNYPLPSASAPANLIAPFFDDLYPYYGTGIYFKDYGDRAVIQYENIEAYNGSGYYTFQVVLSRSGTVTAYYKNLGGQLNSCTVGIQNAARNDGFTVAYNTTYLRNNFALQIENAPPWMTVSEKSGTIPAGGSRVIGVTFDALQLTAGTYGNTLLISHNGLNTPSPIGVPVSLEVAEGTRSFSRLVHVGPAAEAVVGGSAYRLWNLTIGGDSRGRMSGARHQLQLK